MSDDPTVFKVSEEEFDALLEALERPPRVLPRLARLMQEPDMQ